MDSLFQGESIFLHSGDPTDFLIDCNFLTDDDLANLAKLVNKNLVFSLSLGIARGGERFATALEKYEDGGTSNTLLIVDDVLTTGASFRAFKDVARKIYIDKKGKEPDTIIGICIFCRRPQNKPSWVSSIFTMDDIEC